MSDPAHLLARSIDYLEQASVADITSSILRAACLHPDEHLFVLPDPELPSQVYALYESVDLQLKEKLKNALLGALLDWSPRWHGYPALRDLVLGAGYIRASGVVDVLRRIIFSDDVRPSKPQTRDALEVVFGVLGGFAPLPAVRDALERAQNDARYDRHFAAQIFNGLCYCTPDLYPSYLQKFLSVSAGATYYAIDEVIAEMVRLIGTEAVMRHLKQLDAPSSRRIAGVLYGTEHKPSVEGDLGYVDKSGRAYPIAAKNDFPVVHGMAAGFADACRQRFGSVNNYIRNRAAVAGW